METGHNGNGSTGDPTAPKEQPIPEITTASQIVETLEPPKRETKRLTTDLPESDRLTDMQRKFVRAYLVTGDSTQAAQEAGYKWPREMGYQVLQNVEVQRQINYALVNKNISPLQADAGMAELCYTSLGYFLDDDGNVDIVRLKANAHLVRRYKCRRNRKLSTDEIEVTDVEIELHDRLEALKDVRAKYRQMAGSGDAGQTNNQIVQLVILAADSELPKELAGRLLAKVAELTQGVKR